MNPKERLEQYAGEVESVIRAWLPPEDGYQRTVAMAMNYSVKAGGKRRSSSVYA